MTQHLITIFHRFNHIEATIEAFEKYVSSHESFIPAQKRKYVNEFFENAKQNVTRILCVIKAIIPELYGIYEKKLNEADKQYENIDKNQPRNDFWVMYREYEIILDYSYQMLSSILDDN